MWGDEVVQDIAARLGVHLDSPLVGGQFGAYRVSHPEHGALVLKAWPYPRFGPAWKHGAAMSQVLRDAGYPAPRYRTVDWDDRACWSLQELLPGNTPAQLSEPLSEQLVNLTRRHIDAAPSSRDYAQELRGALLTAIDVLATRDVTASIATELKTLAARTSWHAVRACDIVHGDFHSQNLLADGGTVVGIFDWEGAGIGDWRCDLANLVVTSDARAPADALANEDPAIAGLFVAWHAARYLAFDITNHPPERVEAMAPHVERTVAHWWRETTAPRPTDHQ